MRTINICPACKNDCFKVVAKLNKENKYNFNKFDKIKYDGLLSSWLNNINPVVACCNYCGHCWYRHQPGKEQLALMYEKGKPIVGSAKVNRDPTSYMREELRRFKIIIGRSTVTTTLLDFGSGLNRWARAAVDEGFCVTAYEPSINRGADKNIPFELVHLIKELDNRKFDAILLEQVLEHVTDPLSTLIHLHQFCKPQTVIRITVPNLLRNKDGRNIWDTWPFDGKSPHFLAPYEHLHGFTPQSLDFLLSRAGFQNINTITEARSEIVNLFRQAIGFFIPNLNSTLRYVQPKIKTK